MATTRAESRVESAVAKIEKIGEDVGVLSGAISLKETAKYYEDEADAQKKNADNLRNLTVLIALGAVAMGVWAVVQDASDTSTLIAKLAVSAVLGTLATYTATQSGKHRRREARARDLQLQLTAFSPFIAPLHDEVKQLERVRMTRRTFGRIESAQAEEDDTGPTAMSLVRRVLRGEAEPNETT